MHVVKIVASIAPLSLYDECTHHPTLTIRAHTHTHTHHTHTHIHTQTSGSVTSAGSGAGGGTDFFIGDPFGSTGLAPLGGSTSPPSMTTATTSADPFSGQDPFNSDPFASASKEPQVGCLSLSIDNPLPVYLCCAIFYCRRQHGAAQVHLQWIHLEISRVSKLLQTLSVVVTHLVLVTTPLVQNLTRPPHPAETKSIHFKQTLAVATTIVQTQAKQKARKGRRLSFLKHYQRYVCMSVSTLTCLERGIMESC